MSDTVVDVGVVGVGNMGANHARTYASMDGVNLAGVTDADTEQATEIAAQYGTETLDEASLFETVDAATIAVPTEFHYGLTKDALENGVDVLVEKPFIADPDNGRDLIACAEANDAVIQVGHVERFNPVVETLADLLADETVIAAQAHRLMPPPDRSIDDSATMDLMIHDLDLVLALLTPSIDACHGVGTADGRYAVGTLEFGQDGMATLTASHVTEEPVRRLTFSTADRRIKADLLDHTIEIHHAGADGPTDTHGVTCRDAEVVEEFTPPNTDPLEQELQAFRECVTTGTVPRVTARDGIEAVEVAQAIDADRKHNSGSADALKVRPD